MPVETPAYARWQGTTPGAMLCHASAARPCSPALLDPLSYPDAQAVSEGGRQAAWFVCGDFGPAVLRHYRRGGLIAKLVRDRYVWAGESRVRSLAEFRLLADLRAQGLPVPEPLAAGYWRRGLSYRAALLTRRIPGVRPLAAMVDRVPVDAVADAIARLHVAGVWHADLNAFNILIDQSGHPWIIDFDRCKQGSLTTKGRLGNLQRLERSLDKVAGAAGLQLSERIRSRYLHSWPSLAAGR